MEDHSGDDAEILNLDGVRWRYGDEFAEFAAKRSRFGSRAEPAFPADEIERLLADFAEEHRYDERAGDSE